MTGCELVGLDSRIKSILHDDDLLARWHQSTCDLSGNLTSNAYLPQDIRTKLLSVSEYRLRWHELVVKERCFPRLEGPLGEIPGLEIVKGLQGVGIEDHITLFRALRFPTIDRICAAVLADGVSINNYEQLRLEAIYETPVYKEMRRTLQSDLLFGFQPQERIVEGLPVFVLVNDAIQIHRAFRSDSDRVMLVALHVPFQLFEQGTIQLYANTAIDADSRATVRDHHVLEFKNRQGRYTVDMDYLDVRGIHLYETYISGLPIAREQREYMGVVEEFYVVDIKRIDATILAEIDGATFYDNAWFLRGLLGDNNIIGRRPAEFMPARCFKVASRKT